MAKRALLVGCNYPETKVQLSGCANDVKRMHKTLVTRFGFAESDILQLLDTNPKGVQPTGANIRSYLAKLIRRVQPGDVLVFHFSGHGVQVPSEGGVVDETGAEEAIVPTDMNLLTDDDFRELVDKIPPGATFTFISDSCHSGGLIDSSKEQIGGGTTRISHHGSSGGSNSSSSSGGVTDLLGLLHQGFQALNSRDLHTRGLHRSSGSEERVNRHRRDDGDGDGDGEEPPEVETYDHDTYSTSTAKEIPISMLTQLLSERVGHRVEVGNIRTTLFDMFGSDASPTVKCFVKLALEQLKKSRHGQEGILGAVSSLATQLLSARLESQNSEQAAHYTAAAENTQGKYRPRARVGRGDKSSEVGILLSGCQSQETSADAKPTRGEAYGAFSNAIQTVLSQTRAPLSNRELILQVRKTLKSQGFKQHPCLYCSDQNVDAVFISR